MFWRTLCVYHIELEIRETTYTARSASYLRLEIESDGFSGVCVTPSLVLCVCFVDRCLPFCTLPFGHSVVCPSIYGFWLTLWYLQTLLIIFSQSLFKPLF